MPSIFGETNLDSIKTPDFDNSAFIFSGFISFTCKRSFSKIGTNLERVVSAFIKFSKEVNSFVVFCICFGISFCLRFVKTLSFVFVLLLKSLKRDSINSFVFVCLIVSTFGAFVSTTLSALANFSSVAFTSFVSAFDIRLKSVLVDTLILVFLYM